MGDTETQEVETPLVAEFKEELKTYYTPIYVYSVFFGLIFFIGPFLVRKSPDKGIIRCCIMISAFSMWLLWVTVYIAQMNPLMGPRVTNATLVWMGHHWGDPIIIIPKRAIEDNSE